MKNTDRTAKTWRKDKTSWQAWPEDDGTWEVFRVRIIHVCGGVMELMSVGEEQYLTDAQLARKMA